MVPPCAIALATLLFQRTDFTKEERESGPTNFYLWDLHLSQREPFLFAAADPLHVLPACIVGSGLAGAMSMAFGCTLNGTSRWNLRSSGNGKCSAVCDCTGCGNCCFRSAPGSSEKEKCLTMDVQIGSNIGCGMNGNQCLEKLCRYNRVIVKGMNSNIIVNSD